MVSYSGFHLLTSPPSRLLKLETGGDSSGKKGSNSGLRSNVVAVPLSKFLLDIVLNGEKDNGAKLPEQKFMDNTTSYAPVVEILSHNTHKFAEDSRRWYATFNIRTAQST